MEEEAKEEHVPLRPRATCAAPTRGSDTQGTVEAARDRWCKSWQHLPQLLLPNYPSPPAQTHPSPLTAAGNPGQALNWSLEQHVLLQQPFSVLWRNNRVRFSEHL